MAKKRQEQPRHEFTKRQLSQWQRQKRIHRITIIAGTCVLVAVLGIMLGGWYFNELGPMHQTVIKVNDTKFSMAYYIDMLKFYAMGGSLQFSADQVVEIIEQNELIKQEAAKLGITVDNDEIDLELKNYGLPVNQANRDLFGVQLLVSKLRDEYFAPQLPTSAEQRQVMAIFVEAEAKAGEVLASLNTGGRLRYVSC